MRYTFITVKRILILLIVIVCIVALRLVIEKRIYLVGLAPINSDVSTEMLDKDIDAILALYGLTKEDSEILFGEGNSIYDMHYNRDNSKGKSIFINVRPVLFGSHKSYTEIETLMEIWTYIINRKFDCDIEGITYFFTAPSELFQGLSPNEIYMSKDEFLVLYSEIDGDNLTHYQKIKELTNIYVLKTNYQRKSGHIQVTSYVLYDYIIVVVERIFWLVVTWLKVIGIMR